MHKSFRLSDFLTTQMSKDSCRSSTINSLEFIMQLVKDLHCQMANVPAETGAKLK